MDQNRSLTAIRAEWPDREGAVDRRVQREVLRRVESVILEFDMPSYRTGVAQQRGQEQEVNRQE